LGGVFGGGGVDPDGAVLLGNLGELVGDDVFLGGGLGVLEGLLQICEFRGILTDALAQLRVVGCVGHLDLGEGYLLRRIVGGADLGGSLEGHVLEHVREAAVAERIVGRACIHQGVEAEDRSLGALADDQRETVRQYLDCGSLFKAGQVLCVSRR